MSLEIKEVKRRIASTRQIRQVTSALQRMASARLSQDRQALDQAALYKQRILRLIEEVVFAASWQDTALSRLAQHDEAGLPARVVMLGSDRGLCGGYNRLVMEELLRFAATLGGRWARQAPPAAVGAAARRWR